jgi:type IV secretion system protein VirB4
MGQLLDAEQDGLSLGLFQTFEIEQLMNLGERSLVPVLTYLSRRIEKRLTGAPSLIILDEAWLMLGHPVFRDKIREWLKVLRKANCAVVLATQSISDAERSGIIDVLKESCPTKDLPAERRRARAGHSGVLRAHRLSTSGRSRSSPRRSQTGILCRLADWRRLFDMALGPVALAFVGASGRDDLKRISALRTEHGGDWIIHWLQQRGISDAQALLHVD